MATTYTDLSKRDVSFQLIRTNPKLTTNLKLTVDSSGSLWLNSIDANEQLADQKYKRFAISENSNHEVNIHKFYDMGKTPTSISYQVGSTVGTKASARDLKDQYDFEYYTSGAKYLSSRQYSEKFSYLAPIYLDKILPNYFVIFKVPGAANYNAGQGRQLSSTQTVSSFATDLFSNATIVKVFDMTNSSKIGKYISTIISNPMFDMDPLYVNHRSGGYSLYRGASISSGTYVEIPERLDSIFSKSLPQLKVEQYVTQGFERNGLIHPRIINMEFLFDDITAKDYEFNRYFGFYCNAIDLQEIQLDLVAMYTNSISDTPDNDQVYPKQYQQSDDETFIITNENGVTLRASGVTQDLTDFNLNRTNSDNIFFPYLHSKDQDFHLIRPNSWNQYQNTATFKIDDTSFNIGDAFGPTDLVTQETITVSTKDTRSTLRIEFVNNPQHLDSFRLYHPSGASFDSLDGAGKFDEFIFVSSYFTGGQTYSLDYSSTGSVIYVDASINLSEMAKAVTEIISKLRHSSIYAMAIDNNVIVQSRMVGNTYKTLRVRDLEAPSGLPKFKMNNQSTFDLVYADGGFVNTSHPILPYGNAEKLQSQLNDIAIKTTTGWSQIARICPSSDSIVYNPTIQQGEQFISDYENFEVIMLTDDEIVDTAYNRVEIRKLFKPNVGILSLFEVKDFDFSTYTSNYTRNLLLDLYKDFFIPAGVNIIDFSNYTYKVIGNGAVLINGVQYTSSDLFVWQNVSDLTNYSVINGDPILIKSQLMTDLINTRLDISYYDGSQDAIDYVGPFSMKAYHSTPDPNSLTYYRRDKFLYGNVTSEYHVYLENYIPDFATEGRVVPYIAKWGILDSTDCRDNPYRLNSDIMFGQDNFGPSHDETIPTPEKLTHEWFYVESDFEYSLDSGLVKSNFSYFPTPISTSELATNSSYFETYFTYIPTVNGIETDRPKFRYSSLYKNEFTNQYETVFKGAKFVFSELDSNGLVTPNSNRFDGYTFSVILKPIAESVLVKRQPVKYRVIENTNSKSITIVIELAIGHKALIPNTIMIQGWNPTGDSTQDLIRQNELFSNFFVGESFTYLIDQVIVAPNLTQYTGMISGLIPLIGASLGQTILIQYTDSTTGLLQTTILATTGSFVYDAVTSGQIATGDQINDSLVANVFSGSPINIGGSYYSGSRIEVDNPVILGTSGTAGTSGGGGIGGILTTDQFIVKRNVPYFDAMLGDYRIAFNENGVSNLTHSFMYFAKDKKYNSNINAYSTIKLSRGVDLSTNGVFPAFSALNTVRLAGLENYDSFMNSEMNQVITGFSPLYIVKSGSRQILVQSDLASSYSASDLNNAALTGSGLAGTTQTTVILAPSVTASYSLVTQPSVQTNPISYIVLPYPYTTIATWTNSATTLYNTNALPLNSTLDWANAISQLQLFGGAKYFEKVFENISFAKFAQLLNKNQSIISWESYTNGVLSPSQSITITAVEAEVIQKNTMNKIESTRVIANQINAVAGFSITESPTALHEVYRYSGEYDVIFKTISGFKHKFSINNNDLTGSNCCFNTNVDNFFVIPDFEYVKYSKSTILDLENSLNYSSIYPYIGETAIDRTDYNALSSSWDYQYHFEYSTKNKKSMIPGTRRVTEDYSFVSKLLNLPLSITVENFDMVLVSNVDYLSSSFGSSNSIYSVFGNEVRFKIDIPSVVTNCLSNGGLYSEFVKFFKEEDGTQISVDSDILGDLTFTDYLTKYCTSNLVKLYQIDSFQFYEYDDRTIQGNLITFQSLSYSAIQNLGYSLSNSCRINNTKSTIVEGSILLKPNTGVKVVPKIKMSYI